MAVKSQPMGFLDRLAAGLAWLGRCGTTAVAVSILLGILLPPLGALVRPFFPETVFLLLCLAFLRVDPGALWAQFARPWLLIAAAVWIMLIVPVLVGLCLNALDLFDRSPGLLLALMLNVVAPPIFASPALAVLMGLNAAVTLALLLACVAVTPFLSPALVAVFVGPAVTFMEKTPTAPLKVGGTLVRGNGRTVTVWASAEIVIDCQSKMSPKIVRRALGFGTLSCMVAGPICREPERTGET